MMNLGLPEYVSGMTGDKSLSKAVNRGLLLDILRRRGLTSRAALAKESGLNKATVSSQIAELIDMGIVVETEESGDPGVGRKPIMLTIDGSAGYAAGISLSSETLRLVCLDLTEKNIRDDVVPLERTDPDYVFSAIKKALDRAIREAPSSRFGLVGTGIAVPGVVDEGRDELIVRSTKFDWTDVDLRGRVQDAYGCSVHIGNDATLATMAERASDSYDGRDALCIFIDEGIGSGFFIDGALHYGHNGMFGEVGHMTVAHGGKRCPCGNYGCWDVYGSEVALRQNLASGGGFGQMVDAQTMLELARSLPEWSRDIFDDFVSYMTSGVVSLINALSPSSVIINCDVLSASPQLFDTLLEKVRNRIMAYSRSCPIRLSAVGKQAPARGAGMAVVDRFYSALVREG